MKYLNCLLTVVLFIIGCSSDSKKTEKKINEYNKFDTAPIPKSSIAPFVDIEHPGAEVVVQFFVDKLGKVSIPKLLKSSENDVLDKAAIKAIEETTFIPAMFNGEPVPVWTEIEVIFPSTKNKVENVAAITRSELDNVYQGEITNTLEQIGVKVTNQQEIDLKINFQSQISESDIEISALLIEEETNFLKNEIQNFIFHMNNDEGSLQNGVQLYRSASDSRITLIDNSGVVLAESHLEQNNIAEMENHGNRPEIIAAKSMEYGVATRYSSTLNEKFLYVAYAYEEDNDDRRIYVRFSKAIDEIKEQRTLRVYEKELIEALEQSEVNLSSSQKKNFINLFVQRLKKRLEAKNIDTSIEENEKLIKNYVTKLDSKSQDIADELKLEISSFVEYVKNSKSGIQLAAETFGKTSDIRVTLIGPDGTVLADSYLDAADVAKMVNHAARPEVAQSNKITYGLSFRFSKTLQQKFVYVCQRLSNEIRGVEYVRLAKSIRSDYSKISLDDDQIFDLYISIIKRNFNLSGFNVSENQFSKFKKSFKNLSKKNNEMVKVDNRVKKYRLYLDEINKSFDIARIEINEKNNQKFFSQLKSSAEREFNSNNIINVSENEKVVKTYLKNIAYKAQQMKKSTKLEGEYVDYYDNGRIKQKGIYLSGEKHGDWKEYNTRGQLTKIVTFSKGKVIKVENPGAVRDSIIYHANGRVMLQGRTNAGLRDGEWKEYDLKGKLIKITTYDFGDIVSQKNPGAIEEITLYHDNGRVKASGIINNQKRDGVWKFFNTRGIHTTSTTYSNGKIIKTVSKIGKDTPKLREGTAVTYHDNGRIKEQGKYSKGKKNGEWREFDTRGKLTKIKIYDKGKIVHEQSPGKVKPFVSYHDNGRIKEKGMKKNGKRDGEWLLYNKNGKIIRTTQYLSGEIVNKNNSELVGPVTNYFDNGFIKEEGILNDGKRDGVWKIYDEEGSHIQNIIYAKGKMLKKEKIY